MKKKYEQPAVQVFDFELECAFLGNSIQPVVIINDWQPAEEELDFDFDDEEEETWITMPAKFNWCNAFEED